MSAAHQLTIRPAVETDRHLAAGWIIDHGLPAAWPEALPPIGVVCEDADGPAGAVWAHLSCNIGVAHLEGLAMRPGLQLSQSTRVGAALMRGIESAVSALDYRLLIAYALPACARYLKAFGWEEGDPRAKIAMMKAL